MALLAAVHPDAQDVYRFNGSGTGVVQTDSRFGDSYAWQSTGGGIHFSLAGFTKTLSGSGHMLTGRIQWCPVAEGLSTDHSIIRLGGNAGDQLLGTAPLVTLYRKDSTSKFYILVNDNNAGSSSSSASSTSISTGTNYDVELRIEWTSSTSLTATLKVDGTTEITHTHTNAGGLGTITFLSMMIGDATSLAKGETLDWRYGGIATVNDETTTGQGYTGWPRTDHPNMLKAFIIPTANGSTVDWSVTGAATDIDCVDDAIGGLSTAEYVSSGTAASDANEYFTTWTNSIPSDATIYGIMLGAYGDELTLATGMRVGLYDGSEDTRTPYNPNATGVVIIPFITDSGGNDWVQSDISGLEGRWRRLAASAIDWRIYGVWMLVLYEEAAASTQQVTAPTFFAAGGVGVV